MEGNVLFSVPGLLGRRLPRKGNRNSDQFKIAPSWAIMESSFIANWLEFFLAFHDIQRIAKSVLVFPIAS